MEEIHASKHLADLIGDAKTVAAGNTVVIQAELRGKTYSEPSRGVPVDGRAEVVRCVMKPEAVSVAQAAVGFRSGGESLCAEGALFGAGGQLERTARGDGIAELPGAVAQVLFENQVLAEVPAFVVAAENQLQFDLA